MADGDTALLAFSPVLSRRPFTVDEYHRMGEAGILSGTDRVELIEGAIVTMSPMGATHYAITYRLDAALKAAVGSRAMVFVQGPVRLGSHSEPEPDIAVLRRSPDDYERELPGAADVLLVVEVADTTLARDRDVKAPLYAGYGIPEYWLVDTTAREVIVYREPGPDGHYRSVDRVGADGTLAITLLPEASIRVSRVFQPTAP
jgi:Uma2 family endonuclease